jgi:hypothetical protein
LVAAIAPEVDVPVLEGQGIDLVDGRMVVDGEDNGRRLLTTRRDGSTDGFWRCRRIVLTFHSQLQAIAR